MISSGRTHTWNIQPTEDMNLKTLSIILLSFGLTGITLANETFVCTHGDNERRIEVVYVGDGSVPCEVQYTKDGEVQTLWSAQGEAGYCEQKAQAFVGKQQEWGWTCSLQSAAGE